MQDYNFLGQWSTSAQLISNKRQDVKNQKTKKYSKKKNTKNIQLSNQSDQNKQNLYSKFINQTKYWPQLEQIQEVPDMMTTSHRDDKHPKSYRQQNKPIKQDNLKKKSMDKSRKDKTIDKKLKNYKKISNQRRKSNVTRQTLRDKSGSTIQLSRVKTAPKKKQAFHQLDNRTQRVQKSIKMLWDCMGQLWQSTRISQYMSQKNQSKIDLLTKKITQQENNMMEIKLKLSNTHRY